MKQKLTQIFYNFQRMYDRLHYRPMMVRFLNWERRHAAREFMKADE